MKTAPSEQDGLLEKPARFWSKGKKIMRYEAAVGLMALVGVAGWAGLGSHEFESPYYSVDSDSTVVSEDLLVEGSTPAVASILEEGSLLGFLVENAYTRSLGVPIGHDYPWTSASVQVIDPFSVATLTAVGGGAESSYAWSLEPAEGGASIFLDAAAAGSARYGATAHAFELGDWKVRVTEFGADGVTTINAGHGSVLVRYVRRELRDLAFQDREDWLDALATMWRVDGDSGRAVYGANYVSSDELLAVHATNSALRDNDHFHNGAGFLAQHVRLDSTVLMSVQAIDKRVSTPFWDWTIEAQMALDGVIESPLDTPLWTDAWFGSLNYVDDPVVVGAVHYGASTQEFLGRGYEAWAIRDSRWAFAKVKRYLPGDDAPYPVNSFGFLRSPWNNNPSPYVTRVNFRIEAGALAKSWPTCSDLYQFLSPADPVSAVYFMTHLEDQSVHANVHQVLGGTIIDVESTDTFLATLSRANATAETCYQTVMTRHIWRHRLADMKTDCDPDAVKTADDLRACQLDCDGFDDATLVALGAFAADQYKCGYDTRDYASTTPNDLLLDIGRAACAATFLKGEHLEASGTTDPSFFLVHPTLARYWQLKLLTSPTAVTNDWADYDNDIGACVPAIGGCYVDAQDLDTDAETCCGGHFRYSTYYEDVDRTPPPPTAPSNHEIVDRASPLRSDSLNLVFHTFKWDHCKAAGFDIEALMSLPKDQQTLTVAAALAAAPKINDEITTDKVPHREPVQTPRFE